MESSEPTEPTETPEKVEKHTKVVPAPKRGWSAYQKPIFITVVVVLGLALSFCAGMQVEKHGNRGNHFAGDERGLMQNRAGGMRRMGGLGSVTAVSSSSITVQNQRTGTSTTYTIDSSTKITNNGATAAISDIKTGATVLVRTSSSSTTTATTIEVNPRFSSPQMNSLDTPDGGSTQSVNVN